MHHTRNRFLCLAAGTLTAIVIGSSSATIILVIGLVRSGMLTYQRAFILVLGANIGTTFTSIIFSLKIVDYSPVLLLIGLLLKLAAESSPWRLRGNLLLSIGIVLFGLFLIEHAAAPLQHNQDVLRHLHEVNDPLSGVLAGALFAGVIQSSSATMGIVIALAKQSVLPLTLGLGIMLGAEIGTCLDTLVASVGRNVEARRVGIFQLIFNIFSVALWLPMIHVMEAVVTSCFSDVGHQLAAAHVILNVSSALVAMAIMPLLIALIDWLQP